MIVVDSSDALRRALALPLDPRGASLLLRRQAQLGGEIAGHARFVIFQPGDRPTHLADALQGWDLFENPASGTRYGDPDFTPAWEWIEDHGSLWEVCLIGTDDGFANVAIILNTPGVNRDVLALCRAWTPQHA